MKPYYKNDDSFRKFLTMSFVGESAAINLMKPFGHQFEFDGYGAGSREMFKDIQKKGQRTPDLICRKCGQTLEVRAKRRLQIAMSDSPRRPFDRELSPNVWIGFVRVQPIDQRKDQLDPDSYIVPQRICVIPTRELTRTRPMLSKPVTKGEDQGSESYLVWPSTVAVHSGLLSSYHDGNHRLQITGDDGVVHDVLQQDGDHLHHNYDQTPWNSKVVAGESIIRGLPRALDAADLICRS